MKIPCLLVPAMATKRQSPRLLFRPASTLSLWVRYLFTEIHHFFFEIDTGSERWTLALQGYKDWGHQKRCCVVVCVNDTHTRAIMCVCGLVRAVGTEPRATPPAFDEVYLTKTVRLINHNSC